MPTFVFIAKIAALAEIWRWRQDAAVAFDHVPDIPPYEYATPLWGIRISLWFVLSPKPSSFPISLLVRAQRREKPTKVPNNNILSISLSPHTRLHVAVAVRDRVCVASHFYCPVLGRHHHNTYTPSTPKKTPPYQHPEQKASSGEMVSLGQLSWLSCCGF